MVKVESDFSGGTEREVSVVSEADLEKLEEKALEELKNDARKQLQDQIGGDEIFLDESLQNNIVEKKYDKDEGDEADNLALSITVEFSEISYKREDLDTFLQTYMQEQVPSDFSLDTAQSYFRVTKTEQDEDGDVTFTANYEAHLLPKIGITEFHDKILGASTSKLEEEVESLTDKNIVGYEITKERSLPFFGNRLPLKKENITVKLVPY